MQRVNRISIYERRSRRLTLAVLAVAALAVVTLLLATSPMPREKLPARTGPPLADVRTWSFVLNPKNPKSLGPEVDLVVVDHSIAGASVRGMTRAEVDLLRRKPGGGSRIVLAYMSIGEAEAHRHVLAPIWRVLPPKWLGERHEIWKSNFYVHYWDKDWQRLFFDPRPSALRRAAERSLYWLKAYVDRVIEAGFDGVWLDRVDAFAAWRAQRPEAEREMVAFVSQLAHYARGRRPGFLVVPQNGEELLQYPDYLAAIDAVAKEDLLYGLRGNERANSWSEVESSVSYLKAAQASRRPVLVVEYLRDMAKREAARLRLRQLGFIASFSARPPYRWLEVPDRVSWRSIRPPVPAVQTTARP